MVNKNEKSRFLLMLLNMEATVIGYSSVPKWGNYFAKVI